MKYFIVNKEKINRDVTFDNEQMKLHLADILEETELMFNENNISIEKGLKIIFQNKPITIDTKTIIFAFAYNELNNKYKLEAKMLLEEILLKFGEEHSHITKNVIIDLFNEIVLQKNLQIERDTLKKKIVWINRQ